MKTLTVDLGDRSYPIHIGDNILLNADLFKSAIPGKQVLIVTNTTVAPLYLQTLQQQIAPLAEVGTLALPDGEQFKRLDTVNLIYDELMRRRHHRTTTLVALGGGVIGDMVGFAAATYQRGVSFIQVPTTLLAQVDSSVGGKTGVNHALGKNMIGAFYQPRAVLIDTRVLDSLPQREFAAGMAEVIKYGLIQDAGFFKWLEDNAALLMKRDQGALEYAIEKSCRTKAGIVAADEREDGIRALLNLGHTFGHAIEAHQGYGDWLHGEAVACGMVLAGAVSVRRHGLPAGDLERIRELLRSFGLPIHLPQAMNGEHFLDKMQLDKKVLTGRIRYILLDAIGRGIIADDVDPAMVFGAIEDCR